MTPDEKFNRAFANLRQSEGGYTNGKNQVRDEATNMGIKQSTLDRYNKKFPQQLFPKNVKDIEYKHARDIYKDEYWDNTQIPNIKNERIRNAVFDMFVMGGAGTVVQRALNSSAHTQLRVDGIIGTKTINALNNIPENKISEFMETLKTIRINYLQKTVNWRTAARGWTTRTMKY